MVRAHHHDREKPRSLFKLRLGRIFFSILMLAFLAACGASGPSKTVIPAKPTQKKIGARYPASRYIVGKGCVAITNDAAHDQHQADSAARAEIAKQIEDAAKSAGFELSKGYAAGSCKPVFCKEHKACQALVDKTCRHPSLARPSMEAVGMNVMKVVQEAGWEIHSIDSETDPESFPDVVM